MSFYEGATSSNMFFVKDEDAFRKFIEGVTCSVDSLTLYDDYVTEDGRTGFSFRTNGSILGYFEDGDDEDDYNAAYVKFIVKLQQFLAPGSSCQIVESGFSERCETYAEAVVITPDNYRITDLWEIADEMSVEMYKE